MNTPTPRTDAVTVTIGHDMIDSAEYVPYDFACGLETELDQARAEIERLKAAQDETVRIIPEHSMQCAECHKASTHAQWFADGYSPVCPECGAEYRCGAGEG